MANALNDQKPTVDRVEKDLDEAVRRVFEVYGPDLSAFFALVQDQFRRTAEPPIEMHRMLTGKNG